MYEHVSPCAKHPLAPTGPASVDTQSPSPPLATTGSLAIAGDSTHITWLPGDVHRRIASFLPARCFLSLRAACRSIHTALIPDTSARIGVLTAERFARGQYAADMEERRVFRSMATWHPQDRLDVLCAFAGRGATLPEPFGRSGMVQQLASHYRSLSPTDQAHLTIAIVKAYSEGNPTDLRNVFHSITLELYEMGTSTQPLLDHWNGVFAAVDTLEPQDRAAVLAYLARVLHAEVRLADRDPSAAPRLVDDPVHGSAARCGRLLDKFEALPKPVPMPAWLGILDTIGRVGVASAQDREALRERLEALLP